MNTHNYKKATQKAGARGAAPLPETAAPVARRPGTAPSRARCPPSGTRYLKLAEVCDRISLGKSKLYDLIKQGRFPPPVHIGTASRWIESEVEAALAQFAAERDGAGSEPNARV